MTRGTLRAIAIAAMLAVTPLRTFAAGDLGPGAITAIVRDAGGKPVAGALVVADGPAGRRATTTSSGIVTLLALPIGTYVVRVTTAGFVPLMKRIDVSSDVSASVVQLAVTRNSLGLAEGIASSIATVSLGDDANASVGHALATTRDVTFVRAPTSPSGAAPTLLGTSAFETRVELDGIPLAGGAASLAALRFRSAIGLDAFTVQKGPIVTTPTVQGAIGGIIDYRTADFATAPVASGESGYSSSFGAFQHFSTSQSLGSLDVLADVLTGGGTDRTQTFKARLALSRATSLEIASYGSQSSATVDGSNVASVAPAYAIDAHTSIGSAAFAVRAFGSSVDSSGGRPDALGVSAIAARVRGVQGAAEFALGKDTLTLSLDKRSDYTSLPQGSSVATLARTYTSASARTDLTLGRSARLELGDDLSGGTSLARRNDPHVAISVSPTQALTIRASAGSSYAVAPGELAILAAPSASNSPESAFGYRLALDDAVNADDRFDASIFSLRRFDRFATFAGARSVGVDFGYAHHPITGLGGDASIALQRSQAYGALQPIAREADFSSASSLVALEGDPYDTIHTHLSYTTRARVAYGIGATLLGADNALGPRALGFIDASAGVPVSDIGHVSFGIDNIFGARVNDAYLRAYYMPREFTVFFRLGTPK